MAGAPVDQSSCLGEALLAGPALAMSPEHGGVVARHPPDRGLVIVSEIRSDLGQELSIPSAEITEHWNIPLEEDIEPIPAVTNVVFRAGGFVIRVERRAIESVAWEHELLAFLAAEVREVVAPIRAADGTTFLKRSGEGISVFPYLEGEHASRTSAPLDNGVNRLDAINTRLAQYSESPLSGSCLFALRRVAVSG